MKTHSHMKLKSKLFTYCTTLYEQYHNYLTNFHKNSFEHLNLRFIESLNTKTKYLKVKKKL